MFLLDSLLASQLLYGLNGGR
uniref:Uncharacterized protein n=1 Tax=Anguilla anguilla TaxID=7936 RepID=A0A0E9W131_ANGAN